MSAEIKVETHFNCLLNLGNELYWSSERVSDHREGKSYRFKKNEASISLWSWSLVHGENLLAEMDLKSHEVKIVARNPKEKDQVAEDTGKAMKLVVQYLQMHKNPYPSKSTSPLVPARPSSPVSSFNRLANLVSPRRLSCASRRFARSCGAEQSTNTPPSPPSIPPKPTKPVFSPKKPPYPAEPVPPRKHAKSWPLPQPSQEEPTLHELAAMRGRHRIVRLERVKLERAKPIVHEYEYAEES